jgi:cell shape-determining protein MreC
MRRSLLNPRRVLALTVTALATLSLLPTDAGRSLARPFYSLKNALVGPVSEPLHRLTAKVRGPADLPVELGDANELELAKQRIVELQIDLQSANDEIERLTQVRQTLRLRGVRLLSARVTGWSNGSALAPTLTINRGVRQGIQPGQVVADGFNLVGEVGQVGMFDASVRLVTTPGRPLNARFVPPSLTANLPSGDLVVQLEVVTVGGRAMFRGVVDAGAPVHVGDLAHLADDTWPREATGYVLGKVVAITDHPDDPTLRRLVMVEPVISVAHVRDVVVLLPGAADSQLASQEP